MRFRSKYLVWPILALCLALSMSLAGCNKDTDTDSSLDSKIESGDPNSLEKLKARASGSNEYNCDFTRQFGSEKVEGRLYYKDENIRFDMFGASPDDTTVTIVNQEENKTYTYNTKMKKGAVQSPSAFLLDVPLPGEIMSVLNSENSSFVGEPERDGQKCTSFQVTEAQFFSFKFTGEIAIANDSGLPVYASGSRDSINLAYEFKNYSTTGVPMSKFSPPQDIVFD